MMDLLNNLVLGFGVALSPWNVLLCLIGALVGTLVGVLPGLGPLATTDHHEHVQVHELTGGRSNATPNDRFNRTLPISSVGRISFSCSRG